MISSGLGLILELSELIFVGVQCSRFNAGPKKDFFRCVCDPSKLRMGEARTRKCERLLSFINRNIRPRVGADIISVWPDETIIGALFNDVRRPTRDPGNDKERGKHLRRNA